MHILPEKNKAFVDSLGELLGGTKLGSFTAGLFRAFNMQVSIICTKLSEGLTGEGRV